MSTLQVRIPRPIFFGIFLSFVTLVLVSIAMLYLVRLAPSAFRDAFNFAVMNHFNPAVYDTSVFKKAGPQVVDFDSFVATPVALLAAGFTYGLFLGKLDWLRRRKIRGAAIAGAVFSAIVVLSVAATLRYLPLLLAAANLAPPPKTLPRLSSHIIEALLLEFVLYVAAYTVGAWLATLRKRSSVPAAPTMPAGVRQTNSKTA